MIPYKRMGTDIFEDAVDQDDILHCRACHREVVMCEDMTCECGADFTSEDSWISGAQLLALRDRVERDLSEWTELNKAITTKKAKS